RSGLQGQRFRPAGATLRRMGNGRFARARLWDNTGAMFNMSHAKARTRFGDWPLALKSILGFWVVYYLTVVVRAFLGRDPWTVIQTGGFTVASGAFLTFGIYAAIRLLAPRAPLRRQLLVASLASFVAAGALAGLLIAADRYQDKPQDEFRYISKEGY